MVSESKVLDVGCATGFLGRYLQKEKDCTVFGLDVNEDAGTGFDPSQVVGTCREVPHTVASAHMLGLSMG